MGDGGDIHGQVQWAGQARRAPCAITRAGRRNRCAVVMGVGDLFGVGDGEGTAIVCSTAAHPIGESARRLLEA